MPRNNKEQSQQKPSKHRNLKRPVAIAAAIAATAGAASLVPETDTKPKRPPVTDPAVKVVDGIIRAPGFQIEESLEVNGSRYTVSPRPDAPADLQERFWQDPCATVLGKAATKISCQPRISSVVIDSLPGEKPQR